jgi:tetratricopeptide (TPR) repeat protein
MHLDDIYFEDFKAKAYTNRGNAYFCKKKYEYAIMDYTRAIEFTPQDPKLYYKRGLSYFNQVGWKVNEEEPSLNNVIFKLGEDDFETVNRIIQTGEGEKYLSEMLGIEIEYDD